MRSVFAVGRRPPVTLGGDVGGGRPTRYCMVFVTVLVSRHGRLTADVRFMLG